MQPEVFDSRALALLNRLASRKKEPTPPPARSASLSQSAADASFASNTAGRAALVSQMKTTGAVAGNDRSGSFAPFSIVQAPVPNQKPPQSPSFRTQAIGQRPVTAGEQISNSSMRPFTASASAHGRDPAVAMRDITSAAPQNRGLFGSALRANTGPDTATLGQRFSRDEAVPTPQTRVDHMVARLGAGLPSGAAAFAASPQSNIARSFASPGGAGRNPSASRQSDDALSSSVSSNAVPQDGLYLIESLTHPGVFTCHRSREDKNANPERLSVDNRQLTACPVLEGEDRLRLLNYQNNNIQAITNVGNLPNLIFLDLYNNSIKCMTGLQAVTQLRVLMLGKNKISKLEGVDSLHHLDVLDLHSNRINRVEGLTALTELRVLNLAGNSITAVEGMEALYALTELNLRRNVISSVKSIGNLTSLSRLFLSSNQISTLDSIRNLLSNRSIIELALESNPLSEDGSFRTPVIEHMKQLRVLDSRKVSDEERRQASLLMKKEEARAAELHRREGLNEERFALQSTIESEFLEELALAKRGVAVSESGSKKLKGYVEEVSTADGPGILAHGRAWDMLDKHANVSNVTLTCCHVPRYAASLLRLQSLTALSSLTLKRCAIESIAQLLPLQYLTSLSKLNLPDNPVQTSSLLRPFLIWKMPNIVSLDGAKFSPQEVNVSASLFEQFARQISTFYKDASCMSPSVCSATLSAVHLQSLVYSPDQLKGAVKSGSTWEKSAAAAGACVSSAIQAAVVFDSRFAALQKIWHDMPLDCVKDGLFDADMAKLDV